MEKEVQKQILQYLSLKKIWAIRLNTGAALYESRGKTRFVKFGSPGLADIVAFTKGGNCIWIEAKSSVGRQSDSQKEFEKQAKLHGHYYIIARSVDDVMPLFGR